MIKIRNVRSVFLFPVLAIALATLSVTAQPLAEGKKYSKVWGGAALR